MTETEDTPRNGGGKIILSIFFLLILAAGAAGYWYYNMRGIVFTDDARFDGELLDLAPQISGTLMKVFVDEGDRVKKGQLLFSLDKESLDAALAKAEATVYSAEANLAVARAQHKKKVNGPRAGEIRMAEVAEQRTATEARHAIAEWERVKGLNDTHVITASERDRIKTTRDAAKKVHEEAMTRLELLREGTRKEDIAIAAANVKLRKAQVDASKAAVLLARVNLSRTEVHTPFEGLVVRKWQYPGAIVAAGRPILTIFNPPSLKIAANIEEKYLDRVSIGAIVDISIDAYPHLNVTGRVDKILRATNSQFSLIPSQGASGTYIKVAQRVPIKVTVNSHPDLPLGPGLSVEIRIHTSPKNLMRRAIAAQK